MHDPCKNGSMVVSDNVPVVHETLFMAPHAIFSEVLQVILIILFLILK
jgi:hypothetical protein